MNPALPLVPESEMTNEALVSLSGSLLESITDERDALRAEVSRLRLRLAQVAEHGARMAASFECSTTQAGFAFLSGLASDTQRQR